MFTVYYIRVFQWHLDVECSRVDASEPWVPSGRGGCGGVIPPLARTKPVEYLAGLPVWHAETFQHGALESPEVLFQSEMSVRRAC